MLSKSYFAYLLCACLCLCACAASGTTVNQSVKQENTPQLTQAEPKSDDNELQSDKTPVTQQREIRSVDFKDFTYNAYCGDSPPDGETTKVTVKNGKSEAGDGENFPSHFEVAVDAYGDLDGDGKEEAAVSSLCNTGGTGQFSEGYIYTMKNGKPVLLTHFEGGDRGYEGLQSVKIKNGFLLVERNDGKANCCADETLTTKYRWNGKKLVEVGKPISRKLDSAVPIHFAVGKSSKIFELDFEARATKTFVVRVNAEQTIVVTSNAKNINIYPSDFINTQSISKETLANGTKFKASQNGNYGFSVENLGYDNRRIAFNVEIK